jgi:hypothetical protein
MAVEKRVEAHIIVNKYRLPYLVLGSGPTQSTITLLKDSSKEGTGRSGVTRMFWGSNFISHLFQLVMHQLN